MIVTLSPKNRERVWHNKRTDYFAALAMTANIFFGGIATYKSTYSFWAKLVSIVQMVALPLLRQYATRTS